MKLSILICTLDSRKSTLGVLLEHIGNQIHNEGTKAVEVLTMCDSGEMETGAKRNALLDIAKGEYVVFVDDDDWLSDEYIGEILRAAKEGKDAISINGWMTTNGADYHDWMISITHEWVAAHENGKEIYLRYPNHITPVKRVHAVKARFPEVSNFEDKAYADNLRPLLKTETKIDSKLYHYRYSTSNKTY